MKGDKTYLVLIKKEETDHTLSYQNKKYKRSRKKWGCPIKTTRVITESLGMFSTCKNKGVLSKHVVGCGMSPKCKSHTRGNWTKDGDILCNYDSYQMTAKHKAGKFTTLNGPVS